MPTIEVGTGVVPIKGVGAEIVPMWAGVLPPKGIGDEVAAIFGMKGKVAPNDEFGAEVAIMTSRGYSERKLRLCPH